MVIFGGVGNNKVQQFAACGGRMSFPLALQGHRCPRRYTGVAMSVALSILNLIALIVPPIGIWWYFRKAKNRILSEPTDTPIEKANRNQDLKDWKNHYTQIFSLIVFPILIATNVLAVGDSMMSDNLKKMENLESSLNSLKTDYNERLTSIEDYLFPPGGPSGPTVFKRMDELEKARDDLQALMLRVTDPDPKLRKEIYDLSKKVQLMRKEIDSLKHQLGAQIQTRSASGSM